MPESKRISRWIYTLCVLSDRLRDELQQQMAEAPTDPRCREPQIAQYEGIILSAATGTAPDVAFLRILMDGWQCTHQWGIKSVSDQFQSVPNLLDSLDARGIAWLASKDLESVDWDTCRSSDQSPGVYATTAFVDALQCALEFSRRTGCDGLVMCRMAGPSFDDSDFA